MRIGVVLSGGMSKGMYQVGCLRAIEDYFGRDSIRCISGSSIGSLVGYAFSSNQTVTLVSEMQSIDVKQSGRFFPRLSGNAELNEKIRDIVLEDNAFITPLYINVWNFSKRKVEYISLNTLSQREIQDYLCAAIAIPIYSKGVRLEGDILFDGSFIDNIPVFPLLAEPLDFIFCIYFDSKNYVFEDNAFNQKIIKLCQFPGKQRFDNFVFDPTHFDSMIEYAYTYASNTIESLFSEEEVAKIRRRNRERNRNLPFCKQNRWTCDVILTNINKMMQKLAKRHIR